ncbi:MAG: sucA, partial [Rhizobium sp.]|nr:sucA [Rhizobium sp.]
MDASFLTGANAPFILELYARFRQDPATVDPSWVSFFNDLADDEAALLQDLGGASWQESHSLIIGAKSDDDVAPKGAKGGAKDAKGDKAKPAPETTASSAHADNSIRALQLIRAYRARGHQVAQLDPLNLHDPESHPELDYRSHGFAEGDLDREIHLGGILGFERATLRQIVDALKNTYCGTIGVEFTHVQDPKQKAWLQKRIETDRLTPRFSQEGKKAILERLTEAEGFEKFLGIKYTGTKRFGLDGGESAIPALEQVIKRGGALGIKQIVIGMAHRGRLNVLVNVMHKPFSALFSEFQGNSPNPDSVEGSGDVKYHLGTSVHLSLTANPSHLEVVDPVVLGKVRAKQEQMGDTGRKQVMGL